ncbi:glycosyltransferase family 4 protein [Fulvivirgaceae bacterium BMA12]|uniref:Glycosyltransferase family 4 protein n=1 Tax=Agaribacillus aureus TaxID=3051825 RepID=A0ABT8LF35_9BACT|nr:glycosyltransferase family 4 protein [Fulvivirgaceae bacterium BMA12]
MKSAIIHEWLTVFGGAEWVLKSIYQTYPSPIFTLVNDQKFPIEKIGSDMEVNTSFIQRLPLGKKKYRNYLPLFPLAIEQFDLREYDLILSSSYAAAKNVLTHHNQLHICYCHSPIRYAWDLYFQYLKEAKLEKGLKAFIVKMVLHYIRTWDYISSNRVDHFIANSGYIAKRIKKIYNREAKVIYPPVAVDQFDMNPTKEDYYLTASRMVPYKKIDLIVETFSRLPDKRLLVIGDGPDYKKIKSKAGKNIELLGYQPFEKLKEYMQKARAFIFAAEEDFGIVPLEAQACGTPVIAFGKGGSTETILNDRTGVFFHKQDNQNLKKAVLKFESTQDNFDPEEIRKNAERFSTERFVAEYTSFVNQCYEKFKNNNS